MKSFFSSLPLVKVLKKDKIRVQNVKFAGKRKTQDEFNFKIHNNPFEMRLLLFTILFSLTTTLYGQVADLKKKANQGDSEAQYTLGLNYFNGTEVLTDKKKAAFWVRNAYENGYSKAKGTWDKLELWKYFDEDGYTHIAEGSSASKSTGGTYELSGYDGTGSIEFVKKGDRVKLTATGQVSLGMFAGSCGPTGLPNGAYRNFNAIRGGNHGALYCKIGADGVWCLI